MHAVRVVQEKPQQKKDLKAVAQNFSLYSTFKKHWRTVTKENKFQASKGGKLWEGKYMGGN